MKIKLSDLWRWDGTIGRGEYALLGVLLFAIKYNLDRLLAWNVFHQNWTLLEYVERTDDWKGNDKQLFYAAMVAFALPFIWAGIVLTLRRLRSVALPLWLVVLFFIPFVNLIFFAVLCVLPPHGEGTAPVTCKGRVRMFFDGIIPSNRLGSAALAMLIAATVTAAGATLSTSFLHRYGAGLFVAMPFCLGMTSVLIYGYHGRRRLLECLSVSILAMVFAGAALLMIAFEGVICLIMAAPIGIVLSMVGGAIAYAVLCTTWWKDDAGKLFCTVLAAIPCVMGLENFTAPPAPLLAVRTSVDIKAAPERVWQNVVSFSELPPPDDWLFRLGIAYPIRAEIRGKGVGAVRHCCFSTGPFVEPIVVWDEPHLLQFSVTSNPAPMQEWTPYKHIEPPHLYGFLASQRGQFLLTPAKDGGTHLEGTTWYRHNMWPAGYWQVWSDFIIHRIHLRVLKHIKHLSETNERSSL